MTIELQIEVEDQKFKVSVGEGLGDFVWVATYAAKLYSNAKYPKGNYIPTLLKIEQAGGGEHLIPHPRSKIRLYLN